MTEQTFIILKPDAIQRGLLVPITDRFQTLGEIKWVIGRVKSREWCQQHYRHILNRVELVHDYKVMETFMAETLLIGFNLIGDDVIEKARRMAGNTDITQGFHGTIRRDFGLPNYPLCYNLVHVADTSDAARHEINLFLNGDLDYDFGIKTH